MWDVGSGTLGDGWLGEPWTTWRWGIIHVSSVIFMVCVLMFCYSRRFRCDPPLPVNKKIWMKRNYLRLKREGRSGWTHCTCQSFRSAAGGEANFFAKQAWRSQKSWILHPGSCIFRKKTNATPLFIAFPFDLDNWNKQTTLTYQFKNVLTPTLRLLQGLVVCLGVWLVILCGNCVHRILNPSQRWV